NTAHTQKATASNAGPVIAACELYRATQKPAYLRFALQVYHYWWSSMVAPVTYQVADHINADGTKVWWKFSYNEGLMIGAGDALGDLARNQTLQLFAVDWAGPPPFRATQAQENAAVLALCDFASLQGSDPGSEDPPPVVPERSGQRRK